MSGAGETGEDPAITALSALLAGLDAALSAAGGAPLGERIARDPEGVAGELRAAILRVVLLIHAEDRGLLAGAGPRPVREILDRIGRDASGHGAWADLARLDPDGDPWIDAPIADAVTIRILDLLIRREEARRVDGALDLEGIGGVYEALLGVAPTVARGASIAVLPDHAIVDLDAILGAPPADRARILQREASVDLAPRARAALEGARSADEIAAALRKRISPRLPEIIPAGAIALAPTAARRRSGSHYTPPALARTIVERTLGPLLGDRPEPAAILDLRVCDPAMGSGAILLEVCRALGDRLAEARGGDVTEARREVARRCLYGVDRDPIAVDLCRISLWLLTRAPGSPRAFLGDHLRAGDSLIGARAADLGDLGRGIPIAALARRLDAWTALSFWPAHAPAPEDEARRSYLEQAGDDADPAARTAMEVARRERFFHWETAFPDVFVVNGGFHAIVGNPPWVAYAGRAAQPLDDQRYAFYLANSPAFFGYRTLHGIFIHRSATLLRPGGRLGLIVPTSVSDLQGYAPARAAHDELCEPDADLPDFGADAFAGVFQPAMGLVSTRRSAEPRAAITGGAWRLARSELSPEAARLLDRLAALPPLPAALFGERGYQTMGDDAARLLESDAPDPPFTVPLREGRDVGPYLSRPPRIHLDPRGIEPRLRSFASFREVKILIRQTARYPIAALGDGQPFRNSILAGFEDEDHPAPFLLCYLNSAPIRWFHHTRYRDARQGMPQVKIAHLRGLPAPPKDRGAGWKEELAALGRDLGARNRGIEGEEAQRIDAIVARGLALSEADLALVRAWAEDNPLPRSIYGAGR